MPFQTALVALAAALAVGYLAWQGYRTWRGSCSTGCGSGKCAPSGSAEPKLIAPEDLLGRARRRQM